MSIHITIAEPSTMNYGTRPDYDPLAPSWAVTIGHGSDVETRNVDLETLRGWFAVLVRAGVIPQEWADDEQELAEATIRQRIAQTHQRGRQLVASAERAAHAAGFHLLPADPDA